MLNFFFYPFAALSIANPVLNPVDIPVVYPSGYVTIARSNVLSAKSISLENRYNNKMVNDVFKDNILLTLSYLSGEVKSKSEISWEKVASPKIIEFSLKPGESFAFHDQILSAYNKNVVKTTNAHFNYQDGFKSDGYLTGDGVCHLASLIHWAAKDAGLTSNAPTNHDFARINDVPKEYGVSIYNLPGSFETSGRQNLYIENTLQDTVKFVFTYDGVNLSLQIER
ncbi:hypothetical protein A3A76_05990 [Candidatus Woesebacteria bacterium RIFCSPLOWO2_01_FULL_39_23]|uniref:Uncharacterized protein n=1 Tax=Candidatus Woesebacteria bacterium RIFCSPHIGHO2_01_FULL_40_22 TaxID=1802499 RepID=A0A1F7YI29_9BACT|nr:MAG: hypothetical protein A2141_02690 [Candidatus Woesebacteria bacterium RBG_16_40_11]OGM26953.1 MAG: hypothetical protein A2628_05935 [Candidatus Woesebacteria bacterium RIFCSPHIGHO2_01_FULL_40_22]OGM37360.1 MAG: hypothetical protein A3E41_04340 [Candidatus Woesebacteria bacterium RIFCSPHIGHO2_12_FULL_38_9]OGM63227.1 MAG: hypothetical protein A3A76_05990 [Candidatus Woesebacteria bacterium RIFCSPLOWO2_01_FULL_39_23]